MKVSAVIVTYNRLDDLKKTLEAYDKQTVPVSSLIVVDNHSSDGTDEFLKNWLQRTSAYEKVIHLLPDNLGGSGGFYYGMLSAMKMDCDWIYLADDDAVPHADMFEELFKFMNNHPGEMENAVALCSAVNNRGSHTGVHRCRLYKTPVGCFEVTVSEKEYSKDYFYIDLYSFVGTMIRKRALLEAGPARKEFFIYNDDYEHSLRIGKLGTIICVPSAVIDHVDNLQRTREATWRDYYGTRNAVVMHKEHFGSYYAVWRGIRRLLVGSTSLNLKKIHVIWEGVVDGLSGRMNKHAIYKPGWKEH